jgi:hypothetical protein
MDWMLVVKVGVTVVLAVFVIGLVWAVRNSIKSYGDDLTM